MSHGATHRLEGITMSEMQSLYETRRARIEKTIALDLYYTGLTDTASIGREGGEPKEHPLDRKFRISLPIEVPAGGMTWYVIQ